MAEVRASTHPHQVYLEIISEVGLIGLIYFISKALINKIFKKISINTKTNFDDLLIKNHIPSYISFLFPLLFLYSLIPFFGDKYPSIFDGFSKLIEILAVLFLILLLSSIVQREFVIFNNLFK